MRFYLLLFSLLLASCNEKYYSYDDRSYKNAEPGMPSAPGKCFDKTLVQDQYKISQQEFIVYTGDDYTIANVEKRKVVTKAKAVKWEKKKADRECLSANPEDCMVWCLVDLPEEHKEFYTVLDTNAIKEYEIQSLKLTEITHKGGFVVWEEVVCEKDLTQSLLSNLRNALYVGGHLSKIPIDLELDKVTTAALVKYQKEKLLPLGNLNIKTLEALGIEY